MKYVVKDTKTGLYLKHGRFFVKDINEAKVFRSVSAVKNSVGISVDNPKKAEYRAEAREHYETMSRLHGPLLGVIEVRRSTGEQKVVREGWPEEAKKTSTKLERRHWREPFSHKKMPEGLEIVEVKINE